MAALALRHVIFVTSGKVFVLGGKTVVTDKGVATVDLDGVDGDLIALSLWHLGYRIDENGKEIRNPEDLDALIASLTGDVVDTESPAEGSDDDDEDEEAVVDQFVEALTADAEADPED